MAKQTFTTGQVLTAAQMTDLQQTAMTGGAASTKTVSYVLVAADAGTRVAMNAAGSTTITVNTGLFSAGDTVSIQNIGAGVCTVTAGTATVNTSGSLVLAQYQGGILYFTSASAAIFFQFATPASGDIEGVTAGTGISGGGTSGTVTITNSMATAIDAKGDLVAGTGADTFARLAVGANDTVLTAASGEATGLKWATVSSASTAWVNISTTSTTTGTSYTISSLSGYKSLRIFYTGVSQDGVTAPFLRLRFNADTGNNYNYAGAEISGGTTDDSSTGANQDYIQLGRQSTTASDTVSGYIQVDGCAGTDDKIGLVLSGSTGTTNKRSYRYGFRYNAAAEISSITVFWSAGNFDAGSIDIWGSVN